MRGGRILRYFDDFWFVGLEATSEQSRGTESPKLCWG
jgi:hypothetical protein